MRLFFDLHIHSALSPCAEDEMTPNNIVNMARLKELDAIAVTDHHSARNLPAIRECADAAGLVLVPGMEVETAEEVHVVCLFPSVDRAMAMEARVREALPDIRNREDIYGRQLIMDALDNITGTVESLLVTASRLPLEEVVSLCLTLEGVAVPAHVDRDSYSILSNLGMIPDDLGIRCIEISGRCDAEIFLKRHPELAGFGILRSSDAHRLGDLSERESFLEVRERSAAGVIERLLAGKVP